MTLWTLFTELCFFFPCVASVSQARPHLSSLWFGKTWLYQHRAGVGNCFLPIVVSRSVHLTKPLFWDGIQKGIQHGIPACLCWSIVTQLNFVFSWFGTTNCIRDPVSLPKALKSEKFYLRIYWALKPGGYWQNITEAQWDYASNDFWSGKILLFAQYSLQESLTPEREFGINLSKCNSPKSFPKHPGKETSVHFQRFVLPSSHPCW